MAVSPGYLVRYTGQLKLHLVMLACVRGSAILQTTSSCPTQYIQIRERIVSMNLSCTMPILRPAPQHTPFHYLVHTRALLPSKPRLALM